MSDENLIDRLVAGTPEEQLEDAVESAAIRYALGLGKPAPSASDYELCRERHKVSAWTELAREVERAIGAGRRVGLLLRRLRRVGQSFTVPALAAAVAWRQAFYRNEAVEACAAKRSELERDRERTRDRTARMLRETDED